ncbi:hypothetical protein [Tuwongella immobilis]|uniref:Uncharacterized protein n=1 Tax=Tuwongella immobilis TaxID=692036 RepID=A0A6C2YNA0_9BACT|nr:hypothetical protein [Tuwongella immobilis]VIP02372.1 Uncharacterized protein OS=Haliangium ochraceum (strain DSM 14365 / JCM 11303 / SMP-2) GN=Hoch_5190 PE=4 SV=1 [Tuwongella immobilis]VTS01202.1 Uncharacterized protein OS=Haliangium ochraceum (strain DSM 14365 / JCM 11303 / SMP-2) GN=Hoch_5190 PE=4 SV=1 [Tuwongella immobilis]
MDTVFPFGFPFATAFYLTFYVLTLAIHVVFMNYVLAGTGFIAVTSFLKRKPASPDSAAESAAHEGPRTVRSVLIDWMPLMLSGAITAGIAPLLFVQILYKQQFYTANLLLFHRWMSILPVLIVGFYTLYLLKGGWLSRQSKPVVWFVGLFPALCVGFTGYAWTENHLLSVQPTQAWANFYQSDAIFHTEPQLLPRLLVWAVGSIATFAVLVAWQLAGYERRDAAAGESTRESKAPLLAKIALAGMLLTLVATGWYVMMASELTRSAFTGSMALPFLIVATLGMLVQGYGWIRTLQKRSFESIAMACTTAGVLLTIVGMTVCREAIRITTLGEETMTRLMELHQQASTVGGLPAFLIFFVLNIGTVTGCILLVRFGKKTQPSA